MPENWFWHQDRVKAVKEIEKRLEKHLSPREKKKLENFNSRELYASLQSHSSKEAKSLSDISNLLLTYVMQLRRSIDMIENQRQIPKKVEQLRLAKDINLCLDLIDQILIKEINWYQTNTPQLGADIKNRMQFFKSENVEYICKNEISKNNKLILDAAKTAITTILNENINPEKIKLSQKAQEQSKLFKSGNPNVAIIYTNEYTRYSCFAAKDFKAGELIGEATGVVTIGPNPPYGTNDYAYVYGDSEMRDKILPHLKLKDKHTIYISGLKKGNELRYMNHVNKSGQFFLYPDGKKSAINSLLEWGFYDGQFKVLITAIRDIKKGEELKLFYGFEKDYWVDMAHVYNFKTNELVSLKKG